jgi:hypothetical protein
MGLTNYTRLNFTAFLRDTEFYTLPVSDLLESRLIYSTVDDTAVTSLKNIYGDVL